jgi:hypothetical protein
MGYNLDDLIGEDGELREPMPPRKKKPRDPNYWRNLLMAVGVEIVLGIVVTLAALLLFGDGGDGGRQNNDVSTLVAILGATHTPTATETPDATLTREALFVELTQTAAAWTPQQLPSRIHRRSRTRPAPPRRKNRQSHSHRRIRPPLP